MGRRNRKKEILGRLDSKTLDAKFLHEIQYGLNCSPFEAEAVLDVAMDLRAGRINAVLTWMVVDIALSTGLRVSEIANLKVENCDLKRGCLNVVRVKKKREIRESLAVGKELVDHLKKSLTWPSARISSMDRPYRKGLAATKGALFVGSRGPLTSHGLQRIWGRAIE